MIGCNTASWISFQTWFHVKIRHWNSLKFFKIILGMVPCWNKIILGQSTDVGALGLKFFKIILFWHGATALEMKWSKSAIGCVDDVLELSLFCIFSSVFVPRRNLTRNISIGLESLMKDMNPLTRTTRPRWRQCRVSTLTFFWSRCWLVSFYSFLVCMSVLKKCRTENIALCRWRNIKLSKEVNNVRAVWRGPIHFKVGCCAAHGIHHGFCLLKCLFGAMVCVW